MKIEFTLQFTKALKRLKRNYRHILEDLSGLFTQIEAGETPGDLLQEVAPYLVYKARVKNSDANRGKSGGYRVIYYLKTTDTARMLTLYSKSDQTDITAQEILWIIQASDENTQANEHDDSGDQS